MQCYTELTAPTAVSHSVGLSFTSAKSTNLVVAKTSLLQIFELKSLTTEQDPNASDDVETLPQDIAADTLDRTFFTSDIALQKLETTSKLVLVAEHQLSGTISALARIKNQSNAHTPGDVLLVAFREAKISLIGWDPSRFNLATLSIHYYENNIPPTPWAQDISYYPTYLSIDPNNKCAMLRFGPRHVAILPFRHELDTFGADDFDPDLDDPADRPQLIKKMTNGDHAEATTYLSSFVLGLTALDPALIFPAHLAFLQEYREPTFGILSSIKAPSNSMNRERRDMLTYKVFTLDLDLRASTNVLTVPNLPSDLHTILALPLPVGGALLAGPNQLVHVDQAGRTRAVAVNDFAKQLSSFPMADQSELQLKLENCLIEQLGESSELLIIMATGQLAILSFRLDGRLVAGMSIHLITASQISGLIPNGVISCTSLGRGKMFLGNEDNDSVLLGWNKKSAQLSKKRSLADMLGEDKDLSDEDLDLDDDLDDDIYGDDNGASKIKSTASESDPIAPESLSFRVHDRLPNFAPAGDLTLGKSFSHQGKPLTDSNGIEAIELVYPSGRGRDGGLVVARRDLNPVITKETQLPNIKSVWAFHVNEAAGQGLVPKGKEDSEAMLSADAQYDQYILASEAMAEGEDESFLYAVDGNGSMKKVENGNFDNEGATIDVGVMCAGTKIVQVKVNEVRCYNSDLELEQISGYDEEEVTILSASFAGQYLLLLKSDSSVMIYDASSGELEELPLSEELVTTKWLSGCLYRPTGDEAVKVETLLFLLTPEGGVRVFEVPSLKNAYTTDGFPFLPPYLSFEFAPRRYAAKATLTELIVADIGDATHKSPYMILRTSLDDLILYQPFHPTPNPHHGSFINGVRWVKVTQPKLAGKADTYADEANQTTIGPALRRLENVGGYSTVVQIGYSTNFILKEASSSPKVIRMTSSRLTSLNAFHASHCEDGFISVDETKTLRLSRLPADTRYGDSGWPMKKVNMGEEVLQVCFFEPKGLYAAATTKKIEFRLPDDDHHKEWANEGTMLSPMANQGALKLLHPKAWTVLDTLELDHNEVCLSMTVANLSTSEATTARKPFLCAGTLCVLGEDQASRGKIFVLDVIDVVPEPGKPETGHRFRIKAKEDVRGAISAMTEIGPQGFLLVAQGQRAMVRGLIEADKLVPVAFMDIQCFVTTAKVLRGTGMMLLGDVIKGIWFTGYMEEPYKMTLFGRTGNMEVATAEFLPHEKSLYIIAADADKNVHVLQYDPEKSLQGRRLIHKSTFHAGHYAVGMHLLPSTHLQSANGADFASENGVDETEQDTAPVKIEQQILVLNQTGVIALISPVDELQYLRLNALQTYLNAQLEHACGLNPRGYRSVDGGGDAFSGPGVATMGSRGGGASGIRGVVDGSLLMRWTELPKQRQVEAYGRMGVEEDGLRGDLEAVCGRGLGYL